MYKLGPSTLIVTLLAKSYASMDRMLENYVEGFSRDALPIHEHILLGEGAAGRNYAILLCISSESG